MSANSDGSGLQKSDEEIKINILLKCAVSSVVEHYLDTIKRPFLAIFSAFKFPLETIAEPLISLVIIHFSLLTRVFSQNPKF